MTNIGKQVFDDLEIILPLMTDLNRFGIKQNSFFPEFYNKIMLPLPSTDYGNVLALAFQRNYYVVANHLIENYEKYKINLDACAISQEGEVYDVNEVFKYSLDTYTDEKEIENYAYEGKPTIIKEISLLRNNPQKYYKRNELERNIAAKEKVENFISWYTYNKMETRKR